MAVEHVPHDATAEVKDGAFRRTESLFRNFVGSERFPVQTARYRLYVSYACPWVCASFVTVPSPLLETWPCPPRVSPLARRPPNPSFMRRSCVQASRCLAVIALKGLAPDVVSVVVAAPVWDFTKPGTDHHRGMY